MRVNEIEYKDIVTDELLLGAIKNNEMFGFREDYHVLHCLIKIHKPLRFLEIGTHTGRGTSIICNAGKGHKIEVFSLDLPKEEASKSLQYPTEPVGHLCKFTYIQLLGDSLLFNFENLCDKYNFDGWFIDGEHDFNHVLKESTAAINSNAKLIVYHDADMPEVMDGILEAFKNSNKYELYRVIDTRILAALRK